MSQVTHKREIEQIDECFVYWIHLEEHTDMYSQGYIGVSNDPVHRLKQHSHNVKRTNYDNPHLARAFEKYADRLIQSVVFAGSKTECYEQEEVLRHKKNVGWNVNKGGACPPSWEGKTLSEEHKKAISEGKTGKQRKAFTEEHKKNMAEVKKGKVTINAIQIQTPLGIFRSAAEAAKAHQVSYKSIIRWANSDSPSKAQFKHIKNKI